MINTSTSLILDKNSNASVFKEITSFVTNPIVGAIFTLKDESALIAATSHYFSVRNHAVSPDANGLVSVFEKLMHHQEEPFTSASVFAQYKVYEKALFPNEILILHLDNNGCLQEQTYNFSAD